MRVSIDPSLSATGLALWGDGKVLATKTVRPPRGYKGDKFQIQWQQIYEWLTEYEIKFDEEYEEFAMEMPGKHFNIPPIFYIWIKHPHPDMQNKAIGMLKNKARY